MTRMLPFDDVIMNIPASARSELMPEWCDVIISYSMELYGTYKKINLGGLTWPFQADSSQWYYICTKSNYAPFESYLHVLDYISHIFVVLQWLHNEHDGVSNHQPHDCLFNRFFIRKSKKTSTLRVTGLCEGNSLVIGEFPAQRASNAENVSIWWRHVTTLLKSTSWWKKIKWWRISLTYGWAITESCRCYTVILRVAVLFCH